MTMNMKVFNLLLTASLFYGSVAAAQKLPGMRDSIQSDILKEKRIFTVVVPDKYVAGSAERYDVIYVLDGESNINLMSSVQKFTEEEGYMPPLIIVAVHNTDRTRDFLPTKNKDFPTAGGADKFLAFFKNELIPHIDKLYQSSGENLLFGHSFGGVFSMYALLMEPTLFGSYIAADPSFWWDDRYMNKFAVEKLSAAQANKSIFITGREGEGYQGMGIPGMDSTLVSKAPEELNWKIAAYPNETHGSVKLKSVYDGFKFIYDGYNNQSVTFHPMNGIVLKDKPYKIYNFNKSESIRFTRDGTEPTESSSRLEAENNITGPAKIAVKTVGKHSRYSKIKTGDFALGSTLPASAKPKNVKPGGFKYSYYEGEWDKLPDFSKLKPIQTGITDKNFDLHKLPKAINFSCLVEGFLEIQKDGYYIFVLDSDDGSKLFLGNQLLIDYDGLHSNGDDKTYLVPLAKGFYPFRLEFFQKGGGASFHVMYVVPGEEKPKPIAIPFELQYSK